MNKYLLTLKTPELASVFSEGRYYTYKNNRKYFFNYRCTDQNFWRIFEFDFINGKPFGLQECDNSDRVAVISKTTAENYFGTVNAVGMEIEITSKMFRVIGVVSDVPLANENTFADIWIPISFTENYSKTENYFGSCFAAVLAYSKEDLFKIKQEFHSHLKTALAGMPGVTDKSSMACILKTRLERLAGEFIADNDDFGMSEGSTNDKTYTETGGMPKTFKAMLIISIIMFLFMLLPALNLININLSRIMERSSEIGVRKAFGASRNALVKQFIVENLVLTFMGGAVSILLSLISFSIINKSGLIANTELTLNFSVFIISILVCLMFGFIAGVYPAYKMSKLNPVESLRGGE